MSGGILYSSGYSQKNIISLVKGGAGYFDLLERRILGARHSVHLQVYIFDSDATGWRIAEALAAAARRGVQVYVLVDGYASSVNRRMETLWREAGVHFRRFEPLLRSTRFYFGRRLHQKVVVVDAQYALVGGINIADKYNDMGDLPSWLDFALLVEGETAVQLYKICRGFWKGEILFRREIAPPDDAFIKLLDEEACCSVRVRRNDWVKGRHQIWRTYFNLFHQANERITIMCSYFLPGNVLRRQLGKAAKRGVKVQVILAGPSDVMVAKYAERYLYDWMLKHHIEIYEYQASVLHAKLAVVDHKWVTIGSFNINNISAHASLELNLDVRNKPFATGVQAQLDAIIAQDCVQITEKNFATIATRFKRLLYKSAYELIRVVLNLSTFYFKHE